MLEPQSPRLLKRRAHAYGSKKGQLPTTTKCAKRVEFVFMEASVHVCAQWTYNSMIGNGH